MKFNEAHLESLAEEKDAIRRGLQETLELIRTQITEVERLARELGCHPSKVKNYDGSFMMTPLILATSNVLLAIHQITQEDRKNG